MKKTMILSSVLILALGGASLASAAGMHGKGHGGPRGMDVDMMFEQLDTNADGQITKEEMQNAGAARFADADTNGDGFLSSDELTAMAEKRDAARAEKRGDRIARMLEKLDTDGDGKLSQEEMEARGGKGKGKGDRGARMFDRMDADDDGVLTKAEVEAAHAKMAERRGKHGKGNGRDN